MGLSTDQGSLDCGQHGSTPPGFLEARCLQKSAQGKNQWQKLFVIISSFGKEKLFTRNANNPSAIDKRRRYIAPRHGRQDEKYER